MERAGRGSSLYLGKSHINAAFCRPPPYTEGSCYHVGLSDRNRTVNGFPWAFTSLALALMSMALGGLCAYLGRFAMNPDGLSYLDIASETLQHGPGELVSGYWSPGYPALISMSMALFRPTPEGEVPLLHGLNFVIFSVALWGFWFFLRSMQAGWGKLNREANREAPPQSPVFAAFALAVFLWFSLKDIGVAIVTPDLMIAALVFLAGGIVWRIAAGIDGGLRPYVVLGAVLGFGYLFKSAFLPLGLALIAVLFLAPPALSVERKKLAVTGLVLVVVCLPWIVAVSLRLGSPSIGATGKLAYIWYANHRELTSYLGWEGRFGTAYSGLRHPPRMLTTNPVVMEFGSPLPGTHALWYDPSYWWHGAKTEFHATAQLAVVGTNMRVLLDWALRMTPLILGALALRAIHLRGRLHGARRIWIWQCLWPLAAWAIYLPVHAEPRFLGAFMVMFWVSIYRYLLPPVRVGIQTTVLVVAAAAILLPFTISIARATRRSLLHPDVNVDQVAATALRSMGLKPGDRLATVGVDFQPFYARRARLRAVAHVEAPNGAWSLAATDFERVKTCLVSAGIQALIARDRPGLPSPQEWTELDLAGEGTLQVLLLSASPHRP